jgi:hypothetical protein
MVLCMFYHAGVRNVTQVSQTFILRERKNYLKKREFGGVGGSNEIPVSTGICFSPRSLNIWRVRSRECVSYIREG